MRFVKLDIDFHEKRKGSLLGFTLIALALSCAIAVGRVWLETQAQIQHWEGKLSHLTLHNPSKIITTNTDTADVKYMHEVVGMLNRPWEKLFAVLEACATEHVNLTSLQPEPDKSMIRISGQAKDLYTVIAYVRALQKQNYFRQIRLVEHEIDEKPGSHPVHFQLLANWMIK